MTQYVPLIIEYTLVHAFVDSGADVSLISEDFRMSTASLRQRPLVKQFLPLTSISGDKLDSVGTLPANVTLGLHSVSHSFQVIRNCSKPIILGWDFLSAHTIVMNAQTMSLELKGDSISFLTVNQQVPKLVGVTVSTTQVVPSFSETLVSGKLSPPHKGCQLDGYTGVFEPHYQEDSKVGFAWTVTKAVHGSIFLKVVNPSSDDISLHSGTQIGTFYSVSEGKQDDYVVIDKCVNNVNIKEACVANTVPMSTSISPVLPDISDTDLSDVQQKRLKDLLTSFSDVFSQHAHDYGITSVVTHKIRTKDDTPMSQRAYRTSPALKAEMHRQVEQLKAQDVVEDSDSPFSSPVVMVKKKDNTYRFCVDYRKLNSVTVTDALPLPRVDDSLDALSGSQYFSTMDMSAGYWQVELDPQDRHKTAFTTGDGLYQFKVMPMGLKNSPPTFQRLMELVLRGLHWTKCVIYLDDIICMGKDFEDHLQNLTDILVRFREAGLKLNPRKCQFCKASVTYMAHVVSKDGLALDPAHSQRVRDWPTPQFPTEVRAFLGLCSYYRRFVQNYAFKAHPLYRLTHKEVPFEWTDDCAAAFRQLKDALTSPPVMAFPNFEKPFVLSTDASNVAIGAVLAQIQDGNERVVAYASHVLSPSERRWSTYDKELWAIIWSFRHFHHYLTNCPFTIVTDHKPLVGLRKLKFDIDPTGRRGRWAMELDPFDWVIVHKDGKRHTNADAMSRIPVVPQTTQEPLKKAVCTQTDDLSIISQIAVSAGSSCTDCQVRTRPQICLTEGDVVRNNVSRVNLWHTSLCTDGKDISLYQREDLGLSQVYDWVQNQERPSLRRVHGKMRHLWWQFPRLGLNSGVLCRKARLAPGKPEVYQVIIPDALISDTLHYLHGDPCSGHYSAERTLKRAQSLCFWPGMRKAIEEYCESCVACESRRNPVPQRRAPLQSIMAVRPFQMVCTDITEMPVTSKGHRYVLVVQDHFTKYVNAYPMADQKAGTVAQLLCEQYIPEHGVPEELFSDQGRQYESEILHDICDRLKIKKKRTTPYHPRGNGMVERFNRTLKDQLAKVLFHREGEWDQYLPAVVLSFNATPHSSTGYSPFFLVHGREPRLPVHVHIDSPVGDTMETPQTYGNALAGRMETVFQEVFNNGVDQSLRREYYFNRHTKFQPFKVGDRVWMNDPTTQRKKLDPKWKGPYQVISVDMDGIIYTVLDQSRVNAEPKVVHYDRLKPYRSSWKALVRSSTGAGQSVDEGGRRAQPTFTALSGSLPFMSKELEVQGNRDQVIPTVPHMRRPSGRMPEVLRSVQQPLPVLERTTSAVREHCFSDGAVTRSGRVIKRPRKFSC
ncbi:interleukin-13 receptor subunit alpha-1 isoform X1 [Triplophysa rosa]|uniref:interleukin-13 receptor subunit alpha-1 isoform X1 n=1 Tax=Triplophysa rosa TaxID=992332 RepID=UPI00254626FE|nr:interleukin-13 receptor subunit alpha-1 isoform X1 [Triplophysa rosa]